MEMALRIEKTIASFVMILAAALGQEPLRYEVRHDHWRKSCTGTLEAGPDGLSYTETSGKKKEHVWKWSYQDIQQLELAGTRLTVVTYEDNRWKLGADREQQFDLRGGDFLAAYRLLKDKLDQRLVAAIADDPMNLLWEVPVKLLGWTKGSEGVLKVGRERIVFETTKSLFSRTWRYEDIENLSSSGPFQLSLTTFERAKSHYGNLRGFNFQLKSRLPEDKYMELWRRLNQTKGLPVLTSFQGPER
jgi:hypothetical protein